MTTDQISRDRHAAAPDQDRLKAYSRLKLSLASQLRLFRDTLKKRGDDARDRQCEELMVKLAEDRFTLAVLGQFKRGKSSLMNAIIGRELLPTGALPLTSAITVLKFGPRERLVVARQGLRWPTIAPLSQIEEYVTERGNPGNCKKVTTATVEVPLPFLRRGLEFVDTPGVGSAIAANTATTYAFLPACDAVVFVTSVESPFTSVELDFLRAIRHCVHKIFFVINKVDLVSERERREVLEFAAQAVREQMGMDAVRIFPLSCKLALAARAARDTLAYARSGVQSLEEELGRFLAKDKIATFLAAIADRAVRLVEAAAGECDLAKRAKALAPPVLQQHLDAIHRQWRHQAALRRDILEQIRGHVRLECVAMLSPEIDTFLATERWEVAPRLERLVAHNAWQPSASLSKRIGENALRHLHRRASCWMSGQTERLSFAADGSCQGLWEQLQSHLNEIFALAARALGLEPSDESIACLPPWRLEVRCQRPATAYGRWSAGLSWWLHPLPARWVRPWLNNQLQREHARLIASYKAPWLAAIGSELDAALDRRWTECTERAAAIESRVEKTIRGECAEERSEVSLRSIHHAFATLREEILHLPTAHRTMEEQPAAIGEPPASLPSPEPVEMGLGTDLRTRGCPVCSHLFRVVFDCLRHVQYVLASDEKAQAEFAGELGFCPLHTWQLEGVASPVGLSVGYPKLAERLARVLTKVASSERAGQLVAGLVRSSRNCRACRLVRSAEQDYLERLAAFLNDPPGREAYARSQGVCLRHLAMLIAELPDRERISLVLNEAARRFEEMSEDMQAFAMKTDALRRALRNRDEEDAYLRAVTHIAGAKGVSVPWQEEMEI